MSIEQIKALVDRFSDHHAEYTSGQYNETQLRRDFLDPLFESLGWDIFNKKNFSETFREVIHEDALQVEDSTRAPDYCFRLGGRRVFFVEAKKPSVRARIGVSPLLTYGWEKLD
jgi:predicted type IV restriction endonuclease